MRGFGDDAFKGFNGRKSRVLIISHIFSLLNTNLAQIEKARSLQSSFVCVTGVDLFDLGHRINYGEKRCGPRRVTVYTVIHVAGLGAIH